MPFNVIANTARHHRNSVPSTLYVGVTVRHRPRSGSTCQSLPIYMLLD